MAEDLLDIKIFEIVYNKHPNEPMSFIQEEALKMQIAIHKNKVYLKQCLDQGGESQFFPSFGKVGAVQKLEKAAIASSEARDVSTWHISDPEEMKNSIGEEEIKCCICHNSSQHFKSLNRHLRTHGITPEEYKTICGINQNTPLMARKVYELAAQRMRKAKAAQPEAPMNASQAPDLKTPDINPPLGATDIFTQPAQNAAQNG